MKKNPTKYMRFVGCHKRNVVKDLVNSNGLVSKRPLKYKKNDLQKKPVLVNLAKHIYRKL